jgi:hypothetical protein
MRIGWIPAVAILSACAGSGPALTTVAVAPTTTTVETATGQYTLTSVGESRVLRGVTMMRHSRAEASLRALHEELGIPVGTVDGDRRRVGNPMLRVSGRLAGERPSVFLDCGTNPIGVPAADTHMLEVSLITRLEPSGNEATRYQIELKASATPRAGGGRSTCSTTGELERRIARRLDSVARDHGAAPHGRFEVVRPPRNR